LQAQTHAPAGQEFDGKRRSSPTGLRPLRLSPGRAHAAADLQILLDFAHPVSGLARERSNIAYNYGNEVVTTGGSGFGIMAIVVGAERKWITREQAVDRLLRAVLFLSKADSYHGHLSALAQWGDGKTIPFSRKDDGADLVETSYLFEGLLCARQYLTARRKGDGIAQPHQLALERCRMELAYPGRPGPPLLALEPEQWLSMNFELGVGMNA